MKVKSVLGYTIAALAVPAVIAMFVSMHMLAGGLVNSTGLHVSPWLTGGEVIRTIDHGAYKTMVHRPVCDGLFGERSKGFIQVDWTPQAKLPARIDEAIDVDGDGTEEFTILLETANGKATVIGHIRWVRGLEGSYRIKNGRAVRITIQNPHTLKRVK